MSDPRDACHLCKRDTTEGDYVLWVLHDGRLVRVCGICLDRSENAEGVYETLDNTEGAA